MKWDPIKAFFVFRECREAAARNFNRMRLFVCFLRCEHVFVEHRVPRLLSKRDASWEREYCNNHHPFKRIIAESTSPSATVLLIWQLHKIALSRLARRNEIFCAPHATNSQTPGAIYWASRRSNLWRFKYFNMWEVLRNTLWLVFRTIADRAAR